jgi:nitroreductase/uncharacterized protein YciI
MDEYVIFLSPRASGTRPAPESVVAHCERLAELAEGGRCIAAGPFADGPVGGMIVGRFATLDEAREFAETDPFVTSGFETAEVRRWHWSRPENGQMGVIAPRPGSWPAGLEALRLRRTARAFADRALSVELVKALLEAALAAPSELHLQPWRPVVCHDPADRTRLQRCCRDQPQVGSAGVAVVCAVDPELFSSEAPRAVDELIAAGHFRAEDRDARIAFVTSIYAGGRTRDSAIRNGTIFGHQLLLAGLTQGLAGFWLGGFDELALKRELEIPDRVVVAGVVGLGWPAAPLPPLPRRPLEGTVGWGRWPC